MKEYKVVCIDAGCIGGTIDPKKIESTSNSMAGQGYTLSKYAIDLRSQCGPFCPKKTGIMIFERG